MVEKVKQSETNQAYSSAYNYNVFRKDNNTMNTTR